MACASFGLLTIFVLGEARSERRTSAPNCVVSGIPTYSVSNGIGVTPRSAKPQADSSMNSARQAPRSSQDWRGVRVLPGEVHA